jgi:anti-sigma regulatory factor (Ser/Thr protein kinase)/predicted ArsR family transcriptional regulator
MDWYLDPAQPAATSVLRREVGAYLRRHAADPDDVDAAEIVVEELVGNAVRHSDGPVWVSIDWTRPTPLLVVRDLGPTFELDVALPDEVLAEGGRGLFIASQLTEELGHAARAAGGNTVRARLSVPRTSERDHAPPRRSSVSLPRLDEAGEHGFGPEPFLRALVVQLAQTLELTHGPDAAEAAVAQVGMDVGGQMEEEYRVAKDIVDQLAPEQLADCYVRLKHAIDGGFFIIEVTPERIVLGNTRCPFGEVVRHAPSLCRMTSSVFGGIGARNAEGATVLLEERIAVGDPGCRVVVMLGATHDTDVEAIAHAYPAAPASPAGPTSP